MTDQATDQATAEPEAASASASSAPGPAAATTTGKAEAGASADNAAASPSDTDTASASSPKKPARPPGGLRFASLTDQAPAVTYYDSDAGSDDDEVSSVDSYRPSMCARKAPLQRALSKRKSFSLAKTGRVVLSDGDSVDEEDDEDDEDFDWDDLDTALDGIKADIKSIATSGKSFLKKSFFRKRPEFMPPPPPPPPAGSQPEQAATGASSVTTTPVKRSAMSLEGAGEEKLASVESVGGAGSPVKSAQAPTSSDSALGSPARAAAAAPAARFTGVAARAAAVSTSGAAPTTPERPPNVNGKVTLGVSPSSPLLGRALAGAAPVEAASGLMPSLAQQLLENQGQVELAKVGRGVTMYKANQTGYVALSVRNVGATIAKENTPSYARHTTASSLASGYVPAGPLPADQMRPGGVNAGQRRRTSQNGAGDFGLPAPAPPPAGAAPPAAPSGRMARASLVGAPPAAPVPPSKPPVRLPVAPPVCGSSPALLDPAGKGMQQAAAASTTPRSTAERACVTTPTKTTGTMSVVTPQDEPASPVPARVSASGAARGESESGAPPAPVSPQQMRNGSLDLSRNPAVAMKGCLTAEPPPRPVTGNKLTSSPSSRSNSNNGALPPPPPAAGTAAPAGSDKRAASNLASPKAVASESKTVKSG